MKYQVQNNRGEVIAYCDTPENANMVRDALNARAEGSGTRYMVRNA